MEVNIPSGSARPADLNDEAVRQQLGPAAWKATVRLMAIWQVSAEESRHLLGLPSSTSLDDLDSGPLSKELMLRISYLIGIYKGLHILHSERLADEWIWLPNTNVMFGGQTPLAYMIDGGIDALRNVRKLIDARCAGNG